MVKIHAQTMRSVTPPLTAEILCTAPTPDIAPVITWVVLTGMPRGVVRKMLEGAAVSAQKPSIGLNLVIFCPIVFTIRQPPVSVPIAMAAWALKTTHRGTWNSLLSPPAKRRLAIMPMVFCASLPPEPREKAAAENNCKIRDHLLILVGFCLHTIQDVITFNRNPSTSPINGARKIKIIVLYQPDAIITPKPPLAIAAPAYPPIKAWEELLGRPKYQVIMFQAIAPMRPARITEEVTIVISTIPLPIVVATPVPTMRKAMKLKKAAQTTACRGVTTRVETMGEMELAASCMPLVKSKTRAIRMIGMIKNRLVSINNPWYTSSHQPHYT